MIDNPLLINSALEYGAPLFKEIREEHLLEALGFRGADQKFWNPE